MPAPSPKRLLAYSALLANVLFWGAALAIVKRGFAEGLNPFLFLVSRFTIASLLSVPLILIFRRQPTVKKVFRLHSLVLVITLELLGSVIALTALYLGLAQTSGVEANLISSTWPILLIAGSVFFLKEREQKHELIGLLLAALGTFILIGRPFLEGNINGHLTGNLLVFGYSLCNAAYLLLAKKYYHHFNKWAVTTISFFTSAIALFIISASFHLNPLHFLTVDLWQLSFWPLLAIIYMATFGSIIGLSLYLYGQGLIEASEASLFSYLYPLIGVPASIWLLHESIRPLDILALIVIALGVYLAEKR